MHLRRLWPHAPLAILVLASGAVNVIPALGRLPLDAAAFNTVAQYNGTLSIFGPSAQALLGIALMLCGIGLFWRMRVFWAFALLLSILIIGVETARREWNLTLVIPAIMSIGLIVYRDRFSRRTLAANLFLSILSIATVVSYGTVGSFLIGNGFHPAITKISAAFYFTIVTLSTVGYGDIVPVSMQARFFSISLVIFGIAIFATAIATTLGPGITAEVERIFSGTKRRMESSDHVIVVGEGEIAAHTAAALSAAGHLVERITDSASALKPQTLADAHIDKARMIVAACSDDNQNAVIALIAKDVNPKIRVVAVAGSTDAIRHLKLAHADAVFAPSVLGGRLLAQIADGAALPAEYADLISTDTP